MNCALCQNIIEENDKHIRSRSNINVHLNCINPKMDPTELYFFIKNSLYTNFEHVKYKFNT